jgi:hypothetical protein
VSKLILFSIVLVSVVVPIWFSTRRSAKRALRYTQWLILVFIFLWGYLCIAWYPRLVPLD